MQRTDGLCEHGSVPFGCGMCAANLHALRGMQNSLNIKRGMRADEYLGKAQALMIERGKQYDKPEGERSMGKAVTAFNAITGLALKESEGWLLLQLLKDVRQWQNPAFHADSAEDCVAYAALKAEALEQEQA